jgi:hypothetical protein
MAYGLALHGPGLTAAARRAERACGSSYKKKIDAETIQVF